jgi:mRNA interferase MazF
MVIRQGEVYWARLGVPSGSAPGYRRPVIVLQNDLFNLRLAESPGNVRLRKGEADLPKESVANVTQIATIDRADLAERLGALSPGRLGEVLAGVRLVVQPIDL